MAPKGAIEGDRISFTMKVNDQLLANKILPKTLSSGKKIAFLFR